MAVASVHPREVAAWITNHTSADGPPLILDVREPGECAFVSIAPAGAEVLQWPMATIPERADELDPERPTLVLCHSGGRSQQVAHYLDARGFDAIADLIGGVDAWAVEVDPTLPRY